MELVAENKYIVCKPYILKNENKNLIVNTLNSDCFGIVQSSPPGQAYRIGDIIWYDKAFARECNIAGEKFIAVDITNIIATIEGV